MFRPGHQWSDVAGCKYVYWRDPIWGGMGNRLQSLVATFVYALLTNRVMLIPSNSTASDYLCNPFRLSNWAIDVTHHE